ncbi:MAG: DedA family protein [Sedimentisphaerales bacterium]|nr:DedA family protein [Sedimentisphaerales bacterium]
MKPEEESTRGKENPSARQGKAPAGDRPMSPVTDSDQCAWVSPGEGAPAGAPAGAVAGRPPSTVAGWQLHRRLYNWVLHWANTPYGGWALFFLAFAESSFFPVPPDILLAPLTLGNRRRWVRFALTCSVASVVGGVCGYMIGMFLWDHISGWAYSHLAWAGLTEENFHTFQGWYDRYDFWIVFTCGFTPLPYKVCTISAGMARIQFAGFLIASTLSRSARFFIVAGLFWWFGPTIKPFIDRYFNWLCLLFVVLLVGGFALLKYV